MTVAYRLLPPIYIKDRFALARFWHLTSWQTVPILCIFCYSSVTTVLSSAAVISGPYHY